MIILIILGGIVATWIIFAGLVLLCAWFMNAETTTDWQDVPENTPYIDPECEDWRSPAGEDDDLREKNWDEVGDWREVADLEAKREQENG